MINLNVPGFQKRVVLELVQLRTEVRELRSLIEHQPLTANATINNHDVEEMEVASGPLSSVSGYEKLATSCEDSSTRNYLARAVLILIIKHSAFQIVVLQKLLNPR